MLEDLKRVDQSILWRDWMHNSFHFFPRSDLVSHWYSRKNKSNDLVFAGFVPPPHSRFPKDKIDRFPTFKKLDFNWQQIISLTTLSKGFDEQLRGS